MARPDPGRVRSAQLTGAATALRDLQRRAPNRFAELRLEWPELADRIDRIIELVDPPTTPTL
ncbi:hypothetical protein [Dermatobacter hominis]|uniref:hypothetical protein n=1 Tax=Dermatobacter hominis TaxID=2884263 RepID=UPI001D1223E3|nr:hypothetical protein [Dermatobacter hominis]UDY34023.1 hypothetical protein LH044_11775 [Dermatobacter hominis]